MHPVDPPSLPAGHTVSSLRPHGVRPEARGTIAAALLDGPRATEATRRRTQRIDPCLTPADDHGSVDPDAVKSQASRLGARNRPQAGRARGSSDQGRSSDNPWRRRSEEHTSELQSRFDLVCRLLLEKKKT